MHALECCRSKEYVFISRFYTVLSFRLGRREVEDADQSEAPLSKFREKCTL
jgi:hypothetical protein